jgi:hypothetical protein
MVWPHLGGNALRNLFGQRTVAELVDVFHGFSVAAVLRSKRFHFGKQFQRAFRFFGIDGADGMPHVHDDVVAHLHTVNQGNRYFFADATEVDDRRRWDAARPRAREWLNT